MSAMEQSLRRALDAGDPTDPAFRESIYAASERALERMLAARPVDEAAAQAQRIRLAETINLVEQDYYASYGDPGANHGPAPGAVPEAGFDEDAGAQPEPDDPPSAHAADPLPSGRRDGAQPDASAAAADRDEQPAERLRLPQAAEAASPERPTLGTGSVPREPGARARGRLVAIGLAVLAALAVLAYLLYGAVYPPVSAATGAAGATDAAGDGNAAAEDEAWIDLFEGTQLAAISTPAGGRVEAVTAAGDRPAVRMTSAGEGGEIQVAVGPGVVGELAGKTVRIEITVGSPDGEPREFGVRCLFGAETYCGRQRFTTFQSNESFVLDMTVPAGIRDAGSIAFDPAFGEGAKALDLYAVRARVADPA